MTIICPKCRTVRSANAVVPDWQCPECGVAYAKAGGDGATSLAARRSVVVSANSHSGNWSFNVPWGKVIAGVVIVYGAWLGFNRSGAINSMPSRTSQSAEQLAASAGPGDVVMYSATWCPYCSQAKSWLGQYGFKPQICEIDQDSDCSAQLKALDPKAGVPYLIVKGHHMKNGFDTDEFKAALAKQ
jgi:glutaredoxin